MGPASSPAFSLSHEALEHAHASHPWRSERARVPDVALTAWETVNASWPLSQLQLLLVEGAVSAPRRFVQVQRRLSSEVELLSSKSLLAVQR